MKLLRYGLIISLLIVTIVIQSCGGGSEKETNGSLAISDPSVKGPSNGIFTISETVTYTPPSGKVPNSVPVVVTITINGISTAPTSTHYLDSTGRFTITDYVQQAANSVIYTVSATTGDLKSSVATVLAGSSATTTLSATPSSILFTSTDAVGTVKTSTISGGVTPYAVTVNDDSADDLEVTISGSTMSVTKISSPGAVQKQGTITVTDDLGTSITIIVDYY